MNYKYAHNTTGSWSGVLIHINKHTLYSSESHLHYHLVSELCGTRSSFPNGVYVCIYICKFIYMVICTHTYI